MLLAKVAVEEEEEEETMARRDKNAKAKEEVGEKLLVYNNALAKCKVVHFGRTSRAAELHEIMQKSVYIKMASNTAWFLLDLSSLS